MSELSPHHLASLEVPALIQQLLASQQIAFSTVPEQAEQPSAKRIQGILLEDAVGLLLVLLPRDQLLDLKRLHELTGRQMTLIAAARLSKMLDKHSLQTFPALPPLTGSPCIYDERLLAEETLIIESGTAGLLLTLAKIDYQKLLSKASSARLGQPLAAIQPNDSRPQDDRAELTQAVQHFTARRIQQRLEEVVEIPPLPETAQKIIQLRVDPDATVDDITNVVETDPALAAQVISWAASPYYAAPGKIRSVEDAIVRVLGFDLVINLALGLALGKTLSLPKDQPQKATPYWQQAIYTAAVVEGLTRAMPRAQRPEAGIAYLGGLLHNFGYLVLAHLFPPHFSLLCRQMEANAHVTHSLVEQHLLGITREQIGSWLMDHWEMPEELVCALRFQQVPSYEGPHSVYANLLCLALRLLRLRGIGDGPLRPIPEALLARLNLTSAQAEQAVDQVLQAEAALRELAGQFHR